MSKIESAEKFWTKLIDAYSNESLLPVALTNMVEARDAAVAKRAREAADTEWDAKWDQHCWRHEREKAVAVARAREGWFPREDVLRLMLVYAQQRDATPNWDPPSVVLATYEKEMRDAEA